MKTIKLISRPKLGFITHYGVLIGETCLQLTPLGFQKCSLEEFSKNFPIKIEKELPYSSLAEARLKSFRPAEMRYNLFNFNCEHFARFLVEGEAKSTQVQFAAFALGIFALFIITSK